MTLGPPCCSNGITGAGNPDLGIMFIGIEPGQDEMRSRKPLTGQSGQLLDATLDAFSVKRDQVYCTNMGCFYGASLIPGQLDKCSVRLNKEVHQLKPKLIVLLGALACERLLKLPFGKAQGAVIYQPFDNLYMLATYHPAAILRSGDKPDDQNAIAADFVRDIEKVSLFVAARPQAAVVADYTLITNPVQAQNFLNSLPKDQPVTLDIETNYDKEAKLSDPYGKITCVGIGPALEQAYILTPQALQGLSWPDAQWVGHNLYGFDAVALRTQYGISLRVAHDTYLQSYALDERTRKGGLRTGLHKLKSLAREYVGADFYEEEEHKGSPEALYEYNAKDIKYTYRLHTFQQQRLIKENVQDLYEKILIPHANMAAECQYHGANIDIGRLVDLANEFLRRRQDLEKSCIEFMYENDFSWHEEVNLASTQQIGYFLFDILKFPSIKKTKTGKPSVDKTVLEEISLELPWASDLLAERRLSKAIGTYIMNPLEQVKFDGHVHPKCIIPGTRTGRPSYTDPPVNTLPHRKSIGELSRVRSIFIADNLDCTLLEADYAGAELVIGQAFSGDQNMYDDMTEPYWPSGKPDFHARTTEFVIKLGKPCPIHGEFGDKSCLLCERWDFDRDAGKHVNFGIWYGETEYGLARPAPIGTGRPAAENRVFIQNFYRRYTNVYKWQREQEALLTSQGFLVSPSGRKFRFPIVLNKKQLRQGINASVQSLASDYTVTSAIELHAILRTGQYGKLTRILWTTYDSMLLNVERKYLDQVKQLVQTTMTTPRFEGFPSISVDIATGDNLYEVRA